MAKRRKPGRPPAGKDGGRVRDYPQVSVRMSDNKKAELQALGRLTGFTRLEIVLMGMEAAKRSLSPEKRKVLKRTLE